jgi:vitamin B12/bleomycin/antimicrobial peptide transport system ATP-binding/permease protein
MAKRSSKSSGNHASADDVDWTHFRSQVRNLASAVWVSRERNFLVLLAVITAVVIGASAYCQVRLTRWVQEFSDTLARREDISLHQIKFLISFALLLVVFDFIRTFLTIKSDERLRKCLVNDLLDQWLAPKRAFRLSTAGKIGENPDQRIDRDAAYLASLTAELGIDFLESVFLIAFFIGLLWVLSRDIVLPIAGHNFTIPGFMVWVALAFVSITSFVNQRIGRPLIALKEESYAREADFRYALIRVNGEIDGVTLYGCEADERGRLEVIFGTVLENAAKIGTVETLSSSPRHISERFARAVPILALAPFYFALHLLTIGQLAAILISFENIDREMRWLVINY